MATTTVSESSFRTLIEQTMRKNSTDTVEQVLESTVCLLERCAAARSYGLTADENTRNEQAIERGDLIKGICERELSRRAVQNLLGMFSHLVSHI